MPCPLIIIGSGYSAAAAVLHLSAAGMACANMMVIGPGQLGAGQAYGCIADEFRLNVRPDLMRLWLDRPTHFAKWAVTHIDDPQAQTTAGAFYRRRDFNTYIQAQLAAIMDFHDLVHLPELVTSVAPAPAQSSGWRVTTTSGKQIVAEKVILATGNPDPRWPLSVQPPGDADGLVKIPWRGDWLDTVPAAAHIAIVGAGLTAMDAVHALAARHHAGPITIIAPHGTLPPVQLPWQPVTAFDWPQSPLRASEFLRVMRRHLGRGSWDDVHWQERFEALRVGFNDAWDALSVADREKLTRRVGWLWTLARFRAGPQSVSTVKRLQRTGQLMIQTGRLTRLTARTNGWMLHLAMGTTITADWVVNCTGMGRDQLLDQLRATGVMGVTPGGKPIVQKTLQLVDPDGRPHETLFMIGPATGAALGDVIGSTSISRQAYNLAQILSDRAG